MARRSRRRAEILKRLQTSTHLFGTTMFVVSGLALIALIVLTTWPSNTKPGIKPTSTVQPLKIPMIFTLPVPSGVPSTVIVEQVPAGSTTSTTTRENDATTTVVPSTTTSTGSSTTTTNTTRPRPVCTLTQGLVC